MPSKLPVIKANTTHVNIAKMAVIAKAHKRSVSKELEWLIEKHIKEYEKENGEIVNIATISADKNKSLKEKTIESWELGMKIGLGNTAKKDNS